MFKILQARLQQYVNCELPDIQSEFRKGRGTRDQIANIHWIIKKVRDFQKNIYFYFIGYAKAFDCVDHKKLWKILKEMGIPEHLTYLLIRQWDLIKDNPYICWIMEKAREFQKNIYFCLTDYIKAFDCLDHN